MSEYNEYYKTEALFGTPYSELVTFFKEYKPKGRVLDVGCGQGRNALFLAQLGYSVTAVDISSVGVNQMVSHARVESLAIRAVVEDIYAYKDFAGFDVVLLDSMFHFEEADRDKECALIRSIIEQVTVGTVIVFCIADSDGTVSVLKCLLNHSAVDLSVLEDISFIYNYKDQESGNSYPMDYLLYIVKKSKVSVTL